MKTHLSGLKGLIKFYEDLLKTKVIEPGSAGHTRLVQLRMRLNRKRRGYNDTRYI